MSESGPGEKKLDLMADATNSKTQADKEDDTKILSPPKSNHVSGSELECGGRQSDFTDKQAKCK